MITKKIRGDTVDQSFKNKLLSLGFEQKIETLFSLTSIYKLKATLNYWQVFAYYENGKYYFSNNGDLLSEFDTPNVDIEFLLKKIKYEIGKFGCYLDSSKIVKEIDVNNIENDLKDFITAILLVDKMYGE